MRWRSFGVLTLLLAIMSGWSLADDPKIDSAKLQEEREKQREISDKLYDEFHAKIAPRRVMIEVDLKTGSHESWESTYYDGSPTRGFARGWIISRKKGYVSTSRTTDMGTVKVKGDRIALVSESPTNGWGLMPEEYVVVPWDKQVFLGEPNELLAFCNEVNSGQLRRYRPSGQVLLRVEDFDKPRPTGFPQVPTEYKDYLLKTPITGSVIKMGEDKEDVAVWGQASLRSGTSLSLNVGKKDGVRAGMRFYPEQGSIQLAGSRFYVISLRDRQCELLQCGGEEKDRAKMGLRMTTVEPTYDRK